MISEGKLLGPKQTQAAAQAKKEDIEYESYEFNSIHYSMSLLVVLVSVICTKVHVLINLWQEPGQR